MARDRYEPGSAQDEAFVPEAWTGDGADCAQGSIQ